MASAVGIAVLDAIKEDKCQENSAVIGNWFILLFIGYKLVLLFV
jgi:hypothetical protein